jgi:hypothetical protein
MSWLQNLAKSILFVFAGEDPRSRKTKICSNFFKLAHSLWIAGLRPRRLCWIITLLLITPALAQAPLSLTTKTTLPIDISTAPLKTCPSNCDIIIEGTITAKQPVTLVLRVDDTLTTGYASRVNDERSFASGKFKWRKSLNSLKATNARVLERKGITRMMLFLAKGEADITITSFKMEEVEPLPLGAKALSFGGWDTPLPQGFERILAADKRIQGQPFIIRRPNPDPLIANGLRGLNKVHIDWPKGRALVSLWTEDVGEWELLPFPLDRKITINGHEVLRSKLTPPQWLKTRYLAGSDQEPTKGMTAWEAFGQHRGGLVSAEVDVYDDGINIEQLGDSPAALFLSAALVEPAGQRAGLDLVLKNRAAWYSENFALGADSPQQVANHVDATTFSQKNTSGTNYSLLPLREKALDRADEGYLKFNSNIENKLTLNKPKLKLTLAPNSGARASISVSSSQLIATPQMSIITPETLIPGPKIGSPGLPLRIWAAQRQLDRTNAGSNLLVVKDERLRSQINKFPIKPDQPRRYDIWVDAPTKTNAGIYTGEIKIGDANNSATIALEIEVLPVELPPVTKPSGYYLDEAPHLNWFPWPGDARRKQIACDLATLVGFGLNGNAPALSTPINDRNDDFMLDAQLAAQNGNAFPWMAYAPATRAIQGQGLEQATRSINDADQRLMSRGFSRMIWSVADEPSNPDVAAGDLKGWVEALRKNSAGVQLAAHLNNKNDRALVTMFDTVMVNGGYGIDIADLDDIRAKKVQPWLYNTGKPRFTAGLWLWRTAAKHYIQWHARMPTADAFDPTDGREGDVQMFYPSMDLCPAQPDMNADILAMSEGVVDQRWLLWLDKRNEPEAKALATQIKTQLNVPFETISQLDDRAMAKIREDIINLARKLK